MEVRRAAELLLRSTPSPFTAVLTPTSTARWAARRQLSYNHASLYPSRFQRAFTTGARNSSPPSKATASAPTQPQSYNTSNSTTQSDSSVSANTQQNQTQAKEDEYSDINSLSTSLWGSPKPSSTGTTNPFANSSAADMLRNLNRHDNPVAYRSDIDISRMLDPQSSKDTSSSLYASKEERQLYPTIDFEGLNSLVPGPDSKSMRLTPSTGRTVPITPDVDVGRAFRLVDISCGRNRVRQDAVKQRFYERGGTKRKRLKSERWRKRFKDGFKATISRVQQLRKQGW